MIGKWMSKVCVAPRLRVVLRGRVNVCCPDGKLFVWCLPVVCLLWSSCAALFS